MILMLLDLHPREQQLDSSGSRVHQEETSLSKVTLQGDCCTSFLPKKEKMGSLIKS